MRTKKMILGMASCLLGSSLATAGELGPVASGASGFHPLLTVFGGVAGVYSNKSQTLFGTDDEVFVYRAQNNNNSTGLGGVFLGVEHDLPLSGFFMQGGLEYTYFGNARLNGLNVTGIEPSTSTLYSYRYQLQTQQLLAVAKLYTTAQLPITAHPTFYPYVSAGIGAAFNNSKQFNTYPLEAGDLNVAPIFANNNETSFSYSLGIGVDTNINERLRIGLGYRFSGFGQSALGCGQVVVNQYRAPISSTLNASNAYANQFIAQLSYVV